MNQILHILKKDLHRYKWVWVALLVFAAADAYLHGTAAGLMDTRINKGLGLLSTWLGGIVLFVAVVMIVQEETLVDPDADWISRPVHRAKLLASKLIALLLMLAIPCFGQIAILVLNQGAFRIPFALADLLPAFAAWLAQVFLSAQTRTLPRYLLLAAGLYVGMMLVMFLGISAADPVSFTMDIGLLPATWPKHLANLIQAAYWLLAGLGILLFLYQKRRILASWSLVVAAALVSLLLQRSETVDEAFPLDGGDFLTLEGLSLGGTILADSQESVEIKALFSRNEVPEGADLWASVSNLSLSSGDQKIKLTEYDFLQKLREEPGGLLSLTLGYAPKKAVTELGESPLVEFSQTVSLSEQRRVDTIPMTSGACHVQQGNRVGIRSFYHAEPKLTISVGASIPDYSLEPAQASPGDDFLVEPLNGLFSFALADAQGNRLRDFDLSPQFEPFEIGKSADISCEMTGEWDPANYSVIIYRRTVMQSGFSFFSEETTLTR